MSFCFLCFLMMKVYPETGEKAVANATKSIFFYKKE